ncbi:AraC family transcriptional activator of pobA [Devosia subaequoris]|uniref:AraC family transcriptional activator of pobA n=1 Tax=Devosia subaequoris TaxID=395930 RepID=A0A7W6IJR6_9HYPH|nr:helix-turn-helix domain-containing protein [Devosia subaequoris]MBB4050928.1 AraC family transcriptional activator of pobA [Devosia subaequoris]MCP1208402.1 helix-turn-helix domain-containing protein [Devosia subaequoris]
MPLSDSSLNFRPGVELARELDGQVIATTLDTSRWTLPGGHNCVFVLIAGSGTVTTGGEATQLQAPNLIWIPAHQQAELVLLAGSRGAWLTMSDAALGQLALPGHIAEDMRRLAARPQLGTRIERDVAARLSTLFTLMTEELRASAAGSEDMVRHQLAIVAILLWRISDQAPSTPRPAPRTIVSNFLSMVDQQMRSHWSVANYARYLGVSVDRLTSAVQRATGLTPLGLIHARLFAEARQMIENSGMQIAEISVHLGFDDPAYFSRFFKRLSGKSPRQYRLEAAVSQVRDGGSYAAWP